MARMEYQRVQWEKRPVIEDVHLIDNIIDSLIYFELFVVIFFLFVLVV